MLASLAATRAFASRALLNLPALSITCRAGRAVPDGLGRFRPLAGGARSDRRPDPTRSGSGPGPWEWAGSCPCGRSG
ncbi:hypothetical protein FAIPA1_150017 [Frankia sp. AiPs1]